MNLESYFDKNPGSANVSLILFHVKLKFLLIPHPRKPIIAHYHALYLGIRAIVAQSKPLKL